MGVVDDHFHQPEGFRQILFSRVTWFWMFSVVQGQNFPNTYYNF